MPKLESRRRAAAVIYTVIHLVLGIGLLFVLVIIVPRYEQILADFDTELPALTQLVVALGRVASSYWYLFVPLGAAFIAGDFVCLSKLGASNGTLQTAAGLTLAVILLGMVLVALLSVWMPLANLVEALQ